jgi:hypothetical protein
MQLLWLPLNTDRILNFYSTFLNHYTAKHPRTWKKEELIVPYSPGRSLRSENDGLLQQPRDVRTKTYRERRFDRAGATLWNDLSIYLRKNSLFLFLKKV